MKGLALVTVGGTKGKRRLRRSSSDGARSTLLSKVPNAVRAKRARSASPPAKVKGRESRVRVGAAMRNVAATSALSPKARKLRRTSSEGVKPTAMRASQVSARARSTSPPGMPPKAKKDVGGRRKGAAYATTAATSALSPKARKLRRTRSEGVKATAEKISETARYRSVSPPAAGAASRRGARKQQQQRWQKERGCICSGDISAFPKSKEVEAVQQ